MINRIDAIKQVLISLEKVNNIKDLDIVKKIEIDVINNLAYSNHELSV